jgi:hypothetical protein
MSLTLRLSVAVPVLALVMSFSSARAVELNPAAVTFKLPDQIEWRRPRNMLAPRLRCWPVFSLSPASRSTWPSGLRSIISADRISIRTTAFFAPQRNGGFAAA